MPPQATFEEITDVEQIKELPELQSQAKHNTRELHRLGRDLERLGEHHPQYQETKDRVATRRKRSFTIRRRKTTLEEGHRKVKEEEERVQREESSRQLKLPELEERKEQLKAQLLQLAEDTDTAQRKANGPEQRSDAALLHGLHRGAYAAFEVLKRTPSLRSENA